MEQQTLPKRSQIARALFQVAVREAGKLLGKFFNDFLDRPLRHRAFIHLIEQLAAQARVGQQVGVKIENSGGFFLSARREAFAVATKLVCSFFQRRREALTLKGYIKR